MEVGGSDFSVVHLPTRLDVPYLCLNATQLWVAPGLAAQDGWGLLRLWDCMRECISGVCVFVHVYIVWTEKSSYLPTLVLGVAIARPAKCHANAAAAVKLPITAVLAFTACRQSIYSVCDLY